MAANDAGAPVTPGDGPYHEGMRRLQDRFDSRRLADRLSERLSRAAFSAEDRAFVERSRMCFLATADAQGRPDCSVKAGEPGFVRVTGENELAFPSYDGNGMFLSMGNIARSRQIGMLFMSFERPHRLRVQGTASVSRDDPMMSRYREADLLVRVQLSELWQNCPRYIHRYQKVQPSRYVPRAECETPIAGWKRIDMMQDVLSARDVAKARAAGTIGIEEWIDKVKTGDPGA